MKIFHFQCFILNAFPEAGHIHVRCNFSFFALVPERTQTPSDDVTTHTQSSSRLADM